jgi:peptidyl-lysine (3S)-dioxygenase / protease
MLEIRNADAVVEQPDRSLVFVEPHEIFEPFSKFLDSILATSSSPSSPSGQNVKYAQTQNDNLRNEYSGLYPDVPKDVPFARVALGQNADAINFWLGDDRSVTSLHKDNYENIYVQIRGQKHFVLLPPIEMPCVNERLLRKGRYAPSTTNEERGSGNEDKLVINLAPGDEECVPVATWDPDLPDSRTTSYSHLSKPLRLTLNEGDMLYLPAMWYHKVSQTVGKEGFVCAVNYWYDMDFAGPFWAQNAFVRDVLEASGKGEET